MSELRVFLDMFADIGRVDRIVEAPPLPIEGKLPKSEKEDMQDFLDDLLG